MIARINNKMNEIYKNEIFTIKSIDRLNNSITITDDSDKILEIKTKMFQTLYHLLHNRP